MIHEGPKLKWTPEREKAFESLKQLAAENNPLEFIDDNKPLNVAMDACKEGWGAILFQLDEDGKKSIVGIASGTFNATERNWSTNEQEAKAILNGLQAFSNHLLGTHFNMFTDHKNLTYIHSATSPKIIRWRGELNRYMFTAYHIPGRLNWETDYLSRMRLDQGVNSVTGFANHEGLLNSASFLAVDDSDSVDYSVDYSDWDDFCDLKVEQMFPMAS
jgi:hypothetical protein